MAKVVEQVAHPDLVGSGQTALHSHAGGGGDYFALTRYLRASRYHVFPLGTYAAFAITANRLYAMPFPNPAARTITRMAVQVTTNAAGTAHLGIYADDGTIYPGALVADAGEISLATVGLKEITGLNIALSANMLYWLVLVNSAGTTIAGVTAGTGWHLLGNALTALNVVADDYWYVAFTYAALPGTFPGGGTSVTAIIPKIAVGF